MGAPSVPHRISTRSTLRSNASVVPKDGPSVAKSVSGSSGDSPPIERNRLRNASTSWPSTSEGPPGVATRSTERKRTLPRMTLLARIWTPGFGAGVDVHRGRVEDHLTRQVRGLRKQIRAYGTLTARLAGVHANSGAGEVHHHLRAADGVVVDVAHDDPIAVGQSRAHVRQRDHRQAATLRPRGRRPAWSWRKGICADAGAASKAVSRAMAAMRSRRCMMGPSGWW